MRCKISDLIVDLPDAGGLAPRCRDYLYEGTEQADILICEEKYCAERYSVKLPPEMVEYMESAYQFYANLLYYNGMYLHASAVVVDDEAYLFSGHSGVGKSTHTRLWLEQYAPHASIINDDKPALRYQDEKWYVYGTPWCGKDGINENRKATLKGICFLKQGKENRICELTPIQALPKILSQTLRRRLNAEQMQLLLNHIQLLVREIPIYELENRPEPAAARLSYETMRLGAKETTL